MADNSFSSWKEDHLLKGAMQMYVKQGLKLIFLQYEDFSISTVLGHHTYLSDSFFQYARCAK